MTFRNNTFAVMAAAIIALGGCTDSGSTNGQASSNGAEQAHGDVDVDGKLVSTPEAFADAVKSAAPGDRIVLANGVWMDFDALFEAEGTEENPIHVVAQTPGKVILSGASSLRLAGKYLVVSGLVFKDGFTPRNEVISFRKDEATLASNSRVTNTVIDNYSNPNRSQRDLWVGLYGRDNVVDHNHFSGKQNAGPTLAVRLLTEESQENRHHIANNYFGPRPIFGSNGGETMRIGTSHYSLTQSLTVVENNFFDRCSGEVEIVSSKSGGNVFRGNTFYASRGTLTLRHGNGTVVENNFFNGGGAPYTGGVRVINAQQTIKNNYFKDLTGNRFSGALVIMNGVPNSPINRYHQVNGAKVEGNTFDNVDAIELGEGSDAERTAVPVNSIFTRNMVVEQSGKTPFALYDDMSGISFSDNVSASTPPVALKAGFEVQPNLVRSGADGRIAPVNGVGASGEFGVDREATGVSWYAKASEESPFEGGREISLKPGTDVLSAALATAEPGDVFVLASGTYHETIISSINVPVTIRGEGGSKPVISFERPNCFVLTGNGALTLDGLRVTGARAPDGSGNSFISTSSTGGSGNHLLALNGIHVEDFDVNRGFSVVAANKGSFFDRIDVTNSSFRNVSGIAFKLDVETDDYGIYNAEFLSIENSDFEEIGGPITSVYRGGRDESTFGPHVDITGSSFSNVGKQSAPLMVLHGLQKGSFTGNTVRNSKPVALTYTTGLPVFEVSENKAGEGVSGDLIALTDLRNRK